MTNARNKTKWWREPVTGTWRVSFFTDLVRTDLVIRSSSNPQCRFLLNLGIHGRFEMPFKRQSPGGTFSIQRNDMPLATSRTLAQAKNEAVEETRAFLHNAPEVFFFSVGPELCPRPKVKLLTRADLDRISAACAASKDKKDFHRACAAEMFGVSYAAVAEPQRLAAQKAHFCHLHGRRGIEDPRAKKERKTAKK